MIFIKNVKTYPHWKGILLLSLMLLLCTSCKSIEKIPQYLNPLEIPPIEELEDIKKNAKR
jgi:hypothetical protein